MTSAHVVVIGGGFAGLRSAVSLADAGFKVTVLEARNSLGGRARSFADPATGEVVDNGQHLFLAGYEATLRFLKRLGTDDRVIFQDRLSVSFVEAGGRMARLDCPPLPAPWHLWAGLARLSSLSLADKWNFRRVLKSVSDTRSVSDTETVEEWLTALGQSERSRRVFWDPLAIAALNEDPSRASASGLSAVLRVILKGPWPKARLGIPKVGLSDLYTAAARRIIEKKGGEVRLNAPVAALEVQEAQVGSVRLANGSSLTADGVVSSLPPSALIRILPEEVRVADPIFKGLSRFSTSPIISVNLWLDRSVTEEDFVGLVGTRFQWLFNKGKILGRSQDCVSLILSAGHRLIDLSNEALVKVAMEDLKACFPTWEVAGVARSQVIRERDATVSLTVGMERFRPGPRTGLSNFFLAGDWTATGLPATIESAVVSGENCARELLKVK